MKILLGSANPSKKRALEAALIELGIDNYDIMAFKVESDVPSKPIGYEIIRGADNRNQKLKKIAFQENIKYDYLCSIEGGFSFDENGYPYVVTYVVIENTLGEKSTGTSMGIRLTREMYRYLRDGYSLNTLIEKISGTDKNKENSGITGYLTRGLFMREDVDKKAVESSFVSFLFREERDILDKEIEELLKKEND